MSHPRQAKARHFGVSDHAARCGGGAGRRHCRGAGPSEAPAVESAVVQATPEEAPTTRRARIGARLGVGRDLAHGTLLASALVTLAVARNADPSTPEAVEDAQTLVVEIETLNGHLATTNQLMSEAITNAEHLSANVQAGLAGMSAQLGDVEAGVGHARSLLGSQLPEATRSELGTAQEQLQSLQRTLAQESGRLAEQQLAAISRNIAAIGDAVGVATARAPVARATSRLGSRRSRATGSTPTSSGSRLRRPGAEAAELRADAERLRADRSGPAGAHASLRRTAPGAEAGPGGTPPSRRQVELEAVVLDARD